MGNIQEFDFLLLFLCLKNKANNVHICIMYAKSKRERISGMHQGSNLKGS